MDTEPHQPCEEAGEMNSLRRWRRHGTEDGCHAALVEVLEGSPGGSPARPTADWPAMRTTLHGDLTTPASCSAPSCRPRRKPQDVRARLDQGLHPTGAIDLGTTLFGELLPQRRCTHPSRPDLAPAADPPLVPVSVDDVDARVVNADRGSTSTPMLKLLASGVGKLVSNAPARSWAASRRMTFAFFVSIRRNSRGSVRCASSLIWPAISTPVGPAPTTTKVSHSSCSARSSDSSASSKHPKIRPRSSMHHRCSSSLSPLGELIIAEIRLTRTCGRSSCRTPSWWSPAD